MQGLVYRLGRLFAAFLLFNLAIAGVSRADVADHVGPLADAMPLGTDGAWTTSLANGWLMLTNLTEDDAVIYYHGENEPLNGGTRKVSVNVALRSKADNITEIGLVFDYKSPESYKAFTLGSDGAVSLYLRDSEGLSHAATSENQKGLGDGSDILSLDQSATEITLQINGKTAFKLENDNGFADRIGLIAFGSGRFAFDGYEVVQTAAVGQDNDPFPPPADTGATEEADPFPPPASDEGAGDEGGQPEEQTSEGPRTDEPNTGGSGGMEELTPQERYAASVLLGTTFGVLFHELGHAVIGELQIPATGPEEDVADEFAAFILGAAFEEGNLPDDPVERQMVHDLVKYSSLLWYYNGKKMEAQGAQEPWQGEHSPSLKRFRHSFCIIYGGNPERFKDVADLVDLPERTRQRCKVDYIKRYNAWERILASVARDLGPDTPGELPADTPGAKVIVSFDEPTSELGKALMPVFRDTGTIAEIGAYLEQVFVWPRDFRIVFRDCEEVNAWYDPSKAQVTMCYSIIEFFSKTVFEAEAGTQQPGGPQQPDPQQQDPQQPDPQQPTADMAMTFLSGTWTGTIPSQYGPIQAQVIYAKDGNYQTILQSGGNRTDIWGQWSAQPLGQGKIQISINPTRWNPPQICNANGYCQPQYFYPDSFEVEIIDQNSVRSEAGVFKRTQ